MWVPILNVDTAYQYTEKRERKIGTRVLTSQLFGHLLEVLIIRISSTKLLSHQHSSSPSHSFITYSRVPPPLFAGVSDLGSCSHAAALRIVAGVGFLSHIPWEIINVTYNSSDGSSSFPDVIDQFKDIDSSVVIA
ncbi:hypothetical protein VTL71DRAFT_33, partial [Oculimacula yallundae]